MKQTIKNVYPAKDGTHYRVMLESGVNVGLPGGVINELVRPYTGHSDNSFAELQLLRGMSIDLELHTVEAGAEYTTRDGEIRKYKVSGVRVKDIIGLSLSGNENITAVKNSMILERAKMLAEIPEEEELS